MLILCIVWVASPAFSGESTVDLTALSLEELMNIPVYGASKFEQKVKEAPSSVSIVTADEIKKYGYRSLVDILRSVRSFYTSYDRNYAYVGVRSFARPGDYNTRVLVLVDGHPQNENVYGAAYLESAFILDVDLIDRVEVIRGPGSSLYGTNALFAVINVITKRGQDYKGFEASGSGGAFDTYEGRFTYGNRLANGLEFLVSGTHYESDGDDHLYYREFDDPSTNYGIAENGDDDEANSFFAKLSFADFSLEGAFVNRDKKIPTAPWGIAFNDDRNHSIDERGYVDLKYEHRLTNGLGLMTRVFYDYSRYQGKYVYDYSEEGEPYFVMNKDSAHGKWWGSELELTKKFFEKHTAILGAKIVDNIQQDQKNYDQEVYLDDQRDPTDWAVYLQDEYKILKDLTLNAGVRHDHYETFGGTTNPRIALIYNPFQKTTFKLIYGRAFRAPSAYELYYDDGGYAQKSSPDLKPEKIETYEAVCEQQLGKHVLGIFGFFHYKMDKLIALQIDETDGLLVSRNTGEIKANGFELELEGIWAHGLEGRVSYSFQQTEDESTGKTLSNSPKHLAKVNFIAPLYKEKVFLGIEEQFTSRRLSPKGNKVGGFFITNLTFFTRNFIKGLELSGSIYNLFDRQYDDPGSEEHVQNGIEQDGRTFRIKLTYRF